MICLLYGRLEFEIFFCSLLYKYFLAFDQQSMFCLSVTELETKFGSVNQWKLFAAHTLNCRKERNFFLAAGLACVASFKQNKIMKHCWIAEIFSGSFTRHSEVENTL